MTERTLLNLSGDELGHVLSYLPRAADIARTASTSRAFKVAVKNATDERALAARPLPLLRDKLRAVRWVELMQRTTRTLSAGDFHSLSVRNGIVCSWGGMAEGEEEDPAYNAHLGHGEWPAPPAGHLHQESDCLRAPVPLELVNCISVSAGADHSLALDGSGGVWCWGSGVGGTLGLGDEEPRFRPERLASLASTRILQVEAGHYSHSLLLTATGGVLAFGGNTHGELGLGDWGRETSRVQPTAVEGFGGRRVVSVSAGAYMSLALDESGAVWTWGRATCDGDLTPWDEDEYEQNPHVRAFAEGRILLRPTKVTALTSQCVTQAVVGADHILAVTATGTLYAWGNGLMGCLGLGNTPSNRSKYVPPGTRFRGYGMSYALPQVVTPLAGKPVRQVAAGAYCSIALTVAGEVYTWGDQVDNDQVGAWKDAPILEPKLVESLSPPLFPFIRQQLKKLGVRLDSAYDIAYELAALTIDKNVLGTGDLRPSPVVEISAGMRFFLARTADGKTYSWGIGDHGSLGHEYTDDVHWEELEPREIDSVDL